MNVTIPVSIGELWDKYTILLIKQNKVTDKIKLNHVNNELKYLNTFMEKYHYKDNKLFIQLKSINEKLWDIEDSIRLKEKKKIFDDEFIELARSVYYTNDERGDIKKEINILFNSLIHEVKNYEKYN
tara:strand:- start:1574 stop:1954 length:381 start_codon:yes stop_codon:yes gene_type:complete